MRDVALWTDGSSTGQVGPGGWAYILVCGDAEKSEAGYMDDTTNNRMEMTALLMGLRALKAPARVTVFIDSEYVMKPYTEGWLKKWKTAGWINGRGKAKKPVANRDLWEAIDAAMQGHVVSFTQVKGHDTGARYPLNDRCDEMAVAARHDGPVRHIPVELAETEPTTLELV